MAELRAYLTITWTGTGAPSEQDWRDFFAATRNQPLSAAILAAARAAHNRIAHKKRSLDGKIAMVSFEIDTRSRDALLAVLDVEALAIGASGSARVKFEAVLQAEVRQGALDAGATQTQADKLDAAVLVGGGEPALGARAVAIAAAQAYLAEQTVLWHTGE